MTSLRVETKARRPVPVLYLDIDGTVREGKDDPLGRFVNGPEDVRVFPKAIDHMREWKADGGRIVGVSNQGGIALGILTMDQVAAAMVKTHEDTGRLFDRMAWCVHHPMAPDPAMARCWCRKPRAGLALDAVFSLESQQPGEIYPPHLALFVGDRPEDRQCAEALNVDFMDAREWRARQRVSLVHWWDGHVHRESDPELD
jgi:D-glycero-D-manno-heptose 1,7-bisphosphate phosphatase